MKICVIGFGTYGTYLTKRLIEKFGDKVQITAIEIGNEKTQNEAEIGIGSESENASAAKRGRYFGLGGTSARWGGQVLFFDERDNPKNNADWNFIVDVNKKYRQTVLENLLGKSTQINSLFDTDTDVKTGIWLKYSKRNVLKLLDKNILKSVEVIQKQRVTDFKFNNSKIEAVVCQNTEGVTQTTEADVFYLTAGAIESCRLLLDIQNKHNLNLSSDLGKNYGDHLSVELFKVKNHVPNIAGKDFLPRIINGNLKTTRLIAAAKNGNMGFVHPIFNKDVQVFSSIKKMLFGQQKMDFTFKDILIGFEFLVRFGFDILIRKKMYVHRNNWSIQLDIEQSFPNPNTISLSPRNDKFGQKTARLNWSIQDNDREAIEDIKEQIRRWLEENNVDFSTVFGQNTEGSKIEDVYHPVGFMRLGEDENAVLNFENRVNGIKNLYHFSTAMFPSAKSINPTGAGFCFIENHLVLFEKLLKMAQNEQNTEGVYL